MTVYCAWLGREQLLLLVGHIAPPRLMQQLTYAATTHEPDQVLRVDKILAWSVGEFHSAEVDICLPPDMPLRVAHDIGERLEVPSRVPLHPRCVCCVLCVCAVCCVCDMCV